MTIIKYVIFGMIKYVGMILDNISNRGGSLGRQAVHGRPKNTRRIKTLYQILLTVFNINIISHFVEIRK